MSRRRLLVLDSYDVDTLNSAIDRDGTWDVLLLGLSEGWFRWLTPAPPKASANLRFVDPRPLATHAQKQVRTFVLDTVRGLPDRQFAGRTLRDALTALRTSWWYLDTSEKGPYRTPLVFQLYQLAMIDRAMAMERYDEVLVASGQQWLRRSASARRAAGPTVRVLPAGSARESSVSPARRYWRHAMAAIAGTMSMRIIGVVAKWPRLVPAAGGPSVFSFYPAWWTQPTAPGATERFFSSPPPESSFLCWLHGPGWIWRSRRAIAGVIAAHRLVVLQRFVSWRLLLGMLSPIRFARTMGLLRRLRTMEPIPFAGVDVAPLVAADLARSLTAGDPFESPLIADAARNAASHFGLKHVVYRAEFQPSERALVSGLRGVAQTAGFVHYPFGQNYLPIWDRSDPQPRSVASSDTGGEQPLPDGLLTCGAVGRSHLVESGYPGDRIALCGPQRHATLVKRLTMPRDRAALRRAFEVADETPLLLVTPAIVEADAEALCAALMSALEGFGACRLMMRAHPNRPDGGAALARAVAHFGPSRATVLTQDASLYDAIEASDALITIGSTVAFEAMALGCMPIVFENPSTYPATSLEQFVEALYVVHNDAELRAAFDEIRIGSPAAQRRREQWAGTVLRTLGDLSTPVALQLTRAVTELDRAIAG